MVVKCGMDSDMNYDCSHVIRNKIGSQPVWLYLQIGLVYWSWFNKSILTVGVNLGHNPCFDR